MWLHGNFFVDNTASGYVLETNCFCNTGEVNMVSKFYKGDMRPVKVMRLDYAL